MKLTELLKVFSPDNEIKIYNVGSQYISYHGLVKNVDRDCEVVQVYIGFECDFSISVRGWKWK